MVQSLKLELNGTNSAYSLSEKSLVHFFNRPISVTEDIMFWLDHVSRPLLGTVVRQCLIRSVAMGADRLRLRHRTVSVLCLREIAYVGFLSDKTLSNATSVGVCRTTVPENRSRPSGAAFDTLLTITHASDRECVRTLLETEWCS